MGHSGDRGVEVTRVASRADRRVFLDFPWRLYREDPNWVPPLKSGVRAVLDDGKHPFYWDGAADIELFLARRNGLVVGRIAGIHHHRYNRFHERREVHFGFFESVDDPEAAAALLGAVEGWARERGAASVVGPFNPSTNYECGTLVEGFDRPPVLMMTYNPAYYVGLLEGVGYTKAKDLLAYISPVQGRSLDRLKRLAERTRKRNPGVVSRGADLEHFGHEVKAFQEIYNQAWEKNWGFVPMTDAEVELLARELKPLVVPELLRFAFVDGEPAGFLLALPDWNPVLKDLEGMPLRHPLMSLKHQFLTKASDMEGLRLITLGIKAEHRKRGLEGVLMAEGLEAALQLGYSWCEYSWILEDNELIKGAIRLMDGELYKTYRLFEKAV